MTIKRNKNIMLLITFIITIIHIAFITFGGVAIAFNLFDINTYINAMLNEIVKGYDINNYLTTYYFELVLAILVNSWVASIYFKGYKYRVSNKQFAKTIGVYAVVQLLFSAYIPMIFAVITAILMYNRKPSNITEKDVAQSFLSEYKLMAMGEAVARLKELRASGAISEEEYYANLNKILES